MEKATILLVHCGIAKFPTYIKDELINIRRIASKSNITLLANEFNRQSFYEIMETLQLDENSIDFVSIESFPRSEITQQFMNKSSLNTTFRDGFWFNTTNRFFVIADYLDFFNINNVIHIENDYILYFDPTDKLNEFKNFAEFSVPLDIHRAIPGIVWFKTPRSARALSRFIVENADQNDMYSLGQFCINTDQVFSLPLPTLPYDYAVKKGLNLSRYCTGINIFNGIFDAASIGQYLGGVHWMNQLTDSTFFLNESSHLDLRDFNFAWAITNGIRKPQLIHDNCSIQILGIHVHSKNLDGFSHFNHGVPKDCESVVTGEKIQELCALTIGSPSISKFHGYENIKSKTLIEWPEDENGKLLLPGVEIVNSVLSESNIFVYTHLISYFKAFVAPRIDYAFNIISHNSDHSVSISDYQLLNHPYLKNWFAQNCEFNHSKLKPLPLGMQNKQWGSDKVSQLVSTSKNIQKTHLLYINFSLATHPTRKIALDVARELSFATIENNVEYETYLVSLSRHKFCLCPRGNGVDTHRFWEAQYLDCIPIILAQDWTSSYSNLPILIINKWDDLKVIDLDEQYIRISCKSFSRDGLFLSHYIDHILKM